MRHVIFTGLVTALLIAIPMAASAHGPGYWGNEFEVMTAPLSHEIDFDNDLGHQFDLWSTYGNNNDWEILYSDVDLLFESLGSQFYYVTLPAGDYRLALECDSNIRDLDLKITVLGGVVWINRIHYWMWSDKHYWGWAYDHERWLDDNRNDGNLPYIRFTRFSGHWDTVGDLTYNDTNPYVDFTIFPWCPRPRMRILIEVDPYAFKNVDDRESTFGIMVLERQ